MAGGLLLVSALACLALVGALVAAMLGIRSPLRFALAAYVVAWAALVLATAVLSPGERLSRMSLTLALEALALVGVGAWFARGRPRLPARGHWRAPLGDPILALLAGAVAFAGAYLALLAFFTTPNDWDGLTYHETRALLWDEKGGVGYVEAGNDPRLNGNPPVSEIGLYLTMMLPRSERFAALTPFLALWASVVAVVLVGRRLDLSTRAAAYGGLVFATLPVVALHGASILNDLVVASFLLAAVAFLLDRGTPSLVLGAIALGLALGTKFSAVLSLPLVTLVVIAGVPRPRRVPATIALAGGVLLGTPWYILNLVETGSLDGELGSSTEQRADLSFGSVVGTLRALTFDVVDTSGFWRAELYLAVVVGAALAGAGALAWRRSAPRGRTLVLAGLVAALVPLALRVVGPPTRWFWEHAWFKLGREDIALAHGNAWSVLGVPDTSLSWYGAGGAVVIVAGIAAAVAGIRRAELRPYALLLALAPLIVIATFAVAIVYDVWRGRLLMFAIGLACATWGWTIRVRWLSAGVAALCATGLALSLVHSFTKPSGLFALETPISRSIWIRDRIDALTVIRNFDGTPALLRVVENRVPADAELVVAAPIDTFLAPLSGPSLSRTLRLVPDAGRVPPDATWLLVREPAGASGCADAWATVYRDDEQGWRLLRRAARDACGPDTAGL
jgi:hypothetical protein